MTMVGGVATMVGPLVGAAVIIMMQNYLAGYGDWVLVMQGTIFVIVVSLFRRGIVGELAGISWADVWRLPWWSRVAARPNSKDAKAG